MICRAKGQESEVRAVSPRTGRPKLENAKNTRMSLRLRPTEAAILNECAERLNESRTTVIVKGIELVKSELDSQEGK